MSSDDIPETPLGIDPVASRRIFLGMLALLGGAMLTYHLLRRPVGPPPAAIAGDALLVRGRSIYLTRCTGCHGESGRGDGPTAKSVPGPRVGNFTDAHWKHGDRPEQIRTVIAEGARDTAMTAWKGALDEPDIRAVAAYVYYLAGRKVPNELRAP